MVAWYQPGNVTGYNASAGDLSDTQFVLATNSAADTNGVTRLQYRGGQIRARAYINVDLTDIFWIGENRPAHDRWGVAMFVVPANLVAQENPTVSQVMANPWAKFMGYLGPTSYLVATGSGSTGDKSFSIYGPLYRHLSPNTKYWVVVAPVSFTSGRPAGEAQPLRSWGNARAVSIWTNRTPEAPTITSPNNNVVVNSGDTLTLTIQSNDPDAIVGGSSPAYTDMAGVQVQYAALPTPENPSPTWTDLRFADGNGDLTQFGWWIQDSPHQTQANGAFWLRQALTVAIRCGSDSPGAWEGLLPAGRWQIRVRTFDYGHPYPAEQPLARSTGGHLHPELYPAENTSPWSTPVALTISAQVPPPIPVSPVSNAAVVEGTAVNLTWQYRNTANPPFAQANRTVQIRQVGSPTWTMLALTVPGASTSWLVDQGAFPLVSGNAYEWRVRVMDSDGSVSDWSEVARFWVVPAPATGGVRPVPSDTIDGATLGCGTHRVFVYRRGGIERVGELTNLSHVDWSRLRDDISTAKVVVSDWGPDCGALLERLQTWAYELVIFRDNGYTVDRVWEGPITLLTYERESVTVHARDVMVYPYRRVVKQAMSDAGNGDTPTSRAARVLQNVMAPDDPNLLAYLTVISDAGERKQYRSMPANSRTAFEEIDDMASNSGLDYTTVGRSILLWNTKNRIGTLPEFRDEDLGTYPIVSEYGMRMANRYVVSDGNGIAGAASRLNEFGEDPIYGLVEILSNTWASDTADQYDSLTQEAVAKIIASFEAAAERSIADRYPPPVVVRVPDNTTLSPDTPISIQHLVPGVAIPLRSFGTLRKVVGTQKLDSVRVVEGSDGEEGRKETISITMSPFSRDDAQLEEGEVE